MKRFNAAILCTVFLVSLLTGCHGMDGAMNSGSDHTDAEPVEVSLWILPEYDTFEELVKEEFTPDVKKKYPNITLKTELLSWDTGPEKLTVAMATGSTPDMMDDGLSRLAPGIYAGLCADITDLMAKIRDLLKDGYQSEGMINGRNYYLPITASNGYNFTVNTTLAKELGVYDLLPADKVHWSYAEFLDFCRKATAAGKPKGIYATQLWAGTRSSDAAYYSFLMTGGARIINKELTAVAVNTPEAIASLNVLKTLIDEGLVPEGAATTKDESVDPNFEGGKLVFLPMTAGAQSCVRIFNKIKEGSILPFETEFVQMPSPTGKTDPYVVSWGTGGFVIFRNADNKEKIQAAKEVLELWVRTPKIATELCLKNGAASTIKNITPDYGDDTLNKQVREATEANIKFSHSDIGILQPWWSDFRETFYVQLQALYTGTKTAEQVLDDWEATGNAVISKALVSK